MQIANIIRLKRCYENNSTKKLKYSNIPIISNVIFNHSKSSFPSAMAEQRHDIPAKKNVAQKIHFLPTFIMIKIANAMAGISTRPARAFCSKNEIFLINLDKISGAINNESVHHLSEQFFFLQFKNISFVKKFFFLNSNEDSIISKVFRLAK